MVAVNRKGNDGHEAESEPRIALDDMAGIVSAVVALAHDTLETLDLLAEGVLTAGEYETHRDL